MADINSSKMVPPPPPELPVTQLKQHNTVPELKEQLQKKNLSERGTKSDLALRLVKHNSGILNASEVEQEFTIKELKKRLSNKQYSKTLNKSQLAEMYKNEI